MDSLYDDKTKIKVYEKQHHKCPYCYIQKGGILIQKAKQNMNIRKWKVTISYRGRKAVKRKKATVRCFVSGIMVTSQTINIMPITIHI